MKLITNNQIPESLKATLAIDLDTKILLAIERLNTAKKYGADMLSSKHLAVKDAKFLLDCFETLLDRATPHEKE